MNNSRHFLTESYFKNVRDEIKARAAVIKANVDALAEEALDSVDKLQTITLSNLESLNKNFDKKFEIFQEPSAVLLKNVKIDTLDYNYEEIFKNFEKNDNYRKDLLKYEKKYEAVLKQYSFEASNWLPNLRVFGKLVDNRFKIESNSLDLEVKENIKVASMCLVGDQIFTIENKKTRILKVYSKEFIFLRESKILEDSMYRLSAHLTLASDHLDSIFVCDAADSTIYLLNKELSFIVKCIGKRGSIDGCFKAPQDIKFHSNTIFVLDTGNFKIQKFDIDGVFIESHQLFRKGDSIGVLENANCLEISEMQFIAVNAPDSGIHLYDFEMNLKLVIEQLDVKCMTLVRNYLFVLTHHGIIICYQIFPSFSKKFYHQVVFSRELKDFKTSSTAMLWIEDRLYISFPKESKMVVINSLSSTQPPGGVLINSN